MRLGWMVRDGTGENDDSGENEGDLSRQRVTEVF